MRAWLLLGTETDTSELQQACARCSIIPADGHNKPVAHMIVNGLAIILAQFDSLALSK